MEYSGEVIFIGPTEQVSETFKKRVFVVLDKSGKYPNEVMFELVQQNTRLLDEIIIGDIVTVAYDIRGRGYKRKDGTQGWMNSLHAWKVVKYKGEPSKPRDYTDAFPSF